MMNTKIIAGFVSLCLLGTVIPADNSVIADISITANAADTEGTYNELTYEKYSDYIKITQCDKTAVTVDIPAVIDGLPVTHINTWAFLGCKQLVSVNIPDSVTNIGAWAFDGCSALTSITIPESAVSIGIGAFDGTPVLESVNGIQYVGNILIKCEDTSITAASIRPGTTAIANDAFKNCAALKSVTIPDGLVSIGQAAFMYCEELTSIDLPFGLKYIGNSAFSRSGLTSIVISEGITNLSGYTFANCSNLTSVSLPNSLVQIYRDEFVGTALMENQSGVKYADKWIIGCDTDVTEVTIKSDTKGIGYGAFEGCSELTNITLPESISIIGEAVFYKCNNLTVTINNPMCDIYDSPYTLPSGTTICGYENSSAHAYAKDYSRIFISIGSVNSLGDVNNDGIITPIDAAMTLAEYALTATTNQETFTAAQIYAANVNKDQMISPIDAALILEYYAYAATTSGKAMDIEDYLKN